MTTPAATLIAESTPRRRIQVPAWIVLALALLGALLAFLIGGSEGTQLAAGPGFAASPTLDWFIH